MVGGHKGHNISNNALNSKQPVVDQLQRKKNILLKKLTASVTETEIFQEDILEIEEQLQSDQENTLSELDEKLDLMIEMLKNRKDQLAKAVNAHYKKQDIFLMEAKKNVERRKTNLSKIENKINAI